MRAIHARGTITDPVPFAALDHYAALGQRDARRRRYFPPRHAGRIAAAAYRTGYHLERRRRLSHRLAPSRPAAKCEQPHLQPSTAPE